MIHNPFFIPKNNSDPPYAPPVSQISAIFILLALCPDA